MVEAECVRAERSSGEARASERSCFLQQGHNHGHCQQMISWPRQDKDAIKYISDERVELTSHIAMVGNMHLRFVLQNPWKPRISWICNVGGCRGCIGRCFRQACRSRREWRRTRGLGCVWCASPAGVVAAGFRGGDRCC